MSSKFMYQAIVFYSIACCVTCRSYRHPDITFESGLVRLDILFSFYLSGSLTTPDFATSCKVGPLLVKEGKFCGMVYCIVMFKLSELLK